MKAAKLKPILESEKAQDCLQFLYEHGECTIEPHGSYETGFVLHPLGGSAENQNSRFIMASDTMPRLLTHPLLDVEFRTVAVYTGKDGRPPITNSPSMVPTVKLRNWMHLETEEENEEAMIHRLCEIYIHKGRRSDEEDLEGVIGSLYSDLVSIFERKNPKEEDQ